MANIFHDFKAVKQYAIAVKYHISHSNPLVWNFNSIKLEEDFFLCFY